MGNSASSANPKVHSNAASHLSAVAAANQVPTPHRDPNKEKGKEPQRKPSESPAPDDPNGTLKTRKKSLELPDLALLSLAGPYSSRGRQSKPASTPISIPQPPKPSFNDYSENLEKPARQTVFIDSSEHLTTTHHYEAPPEDQYGGGRAPRQKERVRDREKEAQIEREDEAQRERDREQRRRERREQRHQQQQRAGGSGSGATAAPRGRQQPMPEQPNAVARLQDLYERSNQPIVPRADGPPLSSTAPQQRRGHDDQPEDIHRRMAAREQEQRNQQQAEVERRQAARRARYTPEVVRSSIPILLGQRGEEGAAAVAAAAAAESSRGPAPLAASASITFGQSKTGKGKAAAKMALTQIDEAVEGLTIDVTEHQEAIIASTATDGVITLEDSTGDILRHDPVEVTIIWKGGGDEVILARAGDNEWRGRTLMDRLSPTSNLWSLSIFLKPGTHHLRFLVDGQWRVADDLPAAVDDQGSLANYVAVPFSFGNETAAHQIEPADAKRIPEVIKKVIPGQSFWSAESSADGEDDETPRTRPLDPNAQQVKGPAHANPALIGYNEAKWTNVIPAALIEAQREEEQYLAATNGQYDSTGQHGQRVTTGFIPAPNIPPAPSLPRHLDKLILNSKLGETKGKEGRERRRERDRDGNRDRDRDRDGDMGGIGSGQAGRKRDKAERQRERELERAERQREKERLKAEAERDQKAERLRASMQRAVPQAPPPSEYGDDEGPKEDYVVHPIEESHRPLSNTPPPTQPRMGLWDPRAVAAILPPGTMMPPPGAMQTPGQFGMAGGGGYDSRSGSPRMFLHGSPGGTPMYAGQIINQGSASSSLPAPTPSAGPATTPIDVATPVPPSGSSSNDGSGSRLITLDNDNVPNVTDDTSVLPVPTHVVLHHLCTSAIKNGVLAVATTTRYRKKYLTTVYYKPSHPNGSV